MSRIVNVVALSFSDFGFPLLVPAIKGWEVAENGGELEALAVLLWIGGHDLVQ